MSLVLPLNYPFTEHLTALGIQCLRAPADNEIRVGFLNLMPEAEKYETSILSRIGRHPMPIRPVFIRSAIHTYASTDKKHLGQFYMTFDEAVRDFQPEALIITGAPVERIPYEEVRYWSEIVEIMNYSWSRMKGTMGLCWGGLAVGKFMGVEKEVFRQKIFGVFPSRNLKKDHPVTGSDNDIFYCPQSRYAGFVESDLTERSDQIDLLAHSPETGNFIIASKEKNFIGHIGHPEYTVERILFEYHRDQKAGLGNVPKYFDPVHPQYNWETSGNAFFTRWIDSVSR
ncbi:MAG: homoserine O-acetyltransferase/O-succinyltransferase family protein [Syntrophothermus sp.]